MSQEKEFTSICLEFQGWKVESEWLVEGSVYLRLVPLDTKTACCGLCGRAVWKRKGFMPRRIVRHLNQWQRKTYIVFEQRRFHCEWCGKIVPEHVEWVRPYRRHTVMFEQLCASLCDCLAVTVVAEQMQVDKMTLYEIDAAWIEHRHETQRISLAGVRYLGIDEIMVRRTEEKTLMKIPVPIKRRKGDPRSGRRRKQRKYLRKWVWVVRPCFATIIYDLEKGRILAIDEGRTCKIASRLLRSLGPEVLAGIQAVCLDMAACYRKAVQRILPQAKIVFDRFHVKTYVNKAVEEVRKMAQATADQGERQFIFNQRWLLLKSKPEEHEQWRLDNLFQLNTDLALAYQLKDQFDALYAIRNRAEAEKQLNSYLAYCRRCRLTPFQTLARQLVRWKPYLLNYVDYPISNGMVEGTNNVVKRVLYRGFGYRNMHYFFGKTRVATGDLPTMAELGVTVAENRFKAA